MSFRKFPIRISACFPHYVTSEILDARHHSNQPPFQHVPIAEGTLVYGKQSQGFRIIKWRAVSLELHSHLISLIVIVKHIPTLSPSSSSTLYTFDHLRTRHLKLFPTYLNFTLNSLSVFWFYIIIVILLFIKIAGRKVRQRTGWSTQRMDWFIFVN